MNTPSKTVFEAFGELGAACKPTIDGWRRLFWKAVIRTAYAMLKAAGAR